MESRTIMICVLVAVLGIAAAAAGFAAEATRVKKPKPTVVSEGLERLKVECEYPSSPATGLAILALVALVIARVIIASANGDCCSSCQNFRSLPRFPRICVVISWVTSSIAVILFLAGAVLNNKKGLRGDVNYGDYSCYGVRPGIFAGAAIMTLLSVLLAIVYDVYYISAKNGGVKTSGLELGVEAPAIMDKKKKPITDGKRPPKPSQNH